jgi:hypothetical protein
MNFAARGYLAASRAASEREAGLARQLAEDNHTLRANVARQEEIITALTASKNEHERSAAQLTTLGTCTAELKAANAEVKKLKAAQVASAARLAAAEAALAQLDATERANAESALADLKTCHAAAMSTGREALAVAQDSFEEAESLHRQMDALTARFPGGTDVVIQAVQLPSVGQAASAAARDGADVAVTPAADAVAPASGLEAQSETFQWPPVSVVDWVVVIVLAIPCFVLAFIEEAWRTFMLLIRETFSRKLYWGLLVLLALTTCILYVGTEEWADTAPWFGAMKNNPCGPRITFCAANNWGAINVNETRGANKH